MEYQTSTSTVVFAVEEPCAPIASPPLAMGYVPMQQWNGTYEPEKGLCRGTIFPCLDKPFLGGACPNGMCM